MGPDWTLKAGPDCALIDRLSNILTMIHDVTAQAVAVLEASKPPLTGTALMNAARAAVKTPA